MSSTDFQPKPTVLIVGAGLGGVMLGVLLEKASIPYLIFERATTVKPLGSALSVSSPLMPIFEQLDLYDDLCAIGKPSRYSMFVRENKETILALDYIAGTEFSGYGGFIVSRPLFYDLLLKQIPIHKIHFGKRVLSIKDEGDKVEITTTGDEIYRGDILVGADGAYSTVRKSLYERLNKEGKLPQSDLEDLPFKSTCLVGQTVPLNLKQYPQLKDLHFPFYTTFGEDKPYTWTLFSTVENTICWMVLEHLDQYTSETAEEERAHNGENAEWGSNAAQAMCDKTRDFPIVFGDGNRTLGDMYDRTPKELISKVMLEEKIFETWSAGRIVLLGDACHKLNPAGGQGAMTAMHDAIAIANLIYALPSNTTTEIEQAFTEYWTERYSAAAEAFNGSQMLAKFMDKGISGRIALFVAQNLPNWMWRIFVRKRVMLRPQAGWLKEIPSKGSVYPIPSPMK
ncbi:hypothetical protein BGX29_008831 [Mortierella sp. GBA35]|nr:hypothetical protein BGX29_008831 [Mortierella sp. GBA35]